MAVAAIFNDNNGAVTGTGNQTVCTIEADSAVPTTVGAKGSDCRVISKLSWLIVSDGSAAGSINLQLQDANGTYRTIAAAPFPITLAATTTYPGDLEKRCHGAQFLVNLTAGTLPYCELIGIAED